MSAREQEPLQAEDWRTMTGRAAPAAKDAVRAAVLREAGRRLERRKAWRRAAWAAVPLAAAAGLALVLALSVPRAGDAPAERAAMQETPGVADPIAEVEVALASARARLCALYSEREARPRLRSTSLFDRPPELKKQLRGVLSTASGRALAPRVTSKLLERARALDAGEPKKTMERIKETG